MAKTRRRLIADGKTLTKEDLETGKPKTYPDDSHLKKDPPGDFHIKLSKVAGCTVKLGSFWPK